MFSRIERSVGFIAAVLGIGQIAWVVYGQFKSISIPLWLYLSSVLTALIAGIGISRWVSGKSKSANIEAFKEIGRVTFDYLPDSPANNGWTLHVDGENGTPPLFSSAQDSPTPGGIKIVKNDHYALDYSVSQIQSLANMIELYAKFEQAACFYLKVKISSRDSSKMQSVWVAHIIGQGVPAKAFNNEWTVPIQGEILENGWVQFKLSIEDEISKTFGVDGWIFHELIGFRVRGSISISSITLYRIGGK
jgi:hypothetical protein